MYGLLSHMVTERVVRPGVFFALPKLPWKILTCYQDQTQRTKGSWPWALQGPRVAGSHTVTPSVPGGQREVPGPTFI